MIKLTKLISEGVIPLPEKELAVLKKNISAIYTTIKNEVKRDTDATVRDIGFRIQDEIQDALSRFVGSVSEFHVEKAGEYFPYPTISVNATSNVSDKMKSEWIKYSTEDMVFHPESLSDVPPKLPLIVKSGGTGRRDDIIVIGIDVLPFECAMQIMRMDGNAITKNTWDKELTNEFMAVFDHELTHYYQMHKNKATNPAPPTYWKDMKYAKQNPDDTVAWDKAMLKYYADKMEIGAFARETAVELTNKFPKKSPDEILKMIEKGDPKLLKNEDDGLFRYVMMYRRLAKNPNDPVMKRYLKTVYQIMKTMGK